MANGKTPELEPTYTSDLTALIDRYPPNTWLFGHTHMPATLQRGPTRIANVSLGYPGHVGDADVQVSIRGGLLDG